MKLKLIFLVFVLLLAGCATKESMIINESIGKYGVESTQDIPRATIVIKNIPGVTQQANYVENDLLNLKIYTIDDFVMVTVTDYNTIEDIQQKLIDSLRKNLYNISMTNFQGKYIYEIKNLDSVWYLWSSDNKAVLIAFGNMSVPVEIVDAYISKYPSTMKNE